MKKILRVLFAATLALMLHTGSGKADMKIPAKTWTTRELLKALITQSAMKINTLPESSGCRSVSQGPTLGDALSQFISNIGFENEGYEKNPKSKISSKCEASKIPGLSSCEIMFRTGGAGDVDPWACGFRFQIDMEGHIDPASFMCPGTC